MSYTTPQLVSMFRRVGGDLLAPYFWPPETVLHYLDEAQEEFCHEVDALFGDESVAYSASDEELTIPSYVTRIRSGQAPSEKALALYNWEEWQQAVVTDDYGSSTLSVAWRTETGAEPRRLITDAGTSKARLHPIPTAGGSVRLQVIRMQKLRMVDGEDMEIQDHVFQRAIVKKAVAEALLEDDLETYDPVKSARFRAEFEEAVRKAQKRVSRRKRRARQTTYGGY